MSDHKAYLELYLAHRTALVDYALSIVGCRANAEDVVQEAWLRFSGRGADATPVAQPLGYLYRIVRNLAFDHTRRQAGELQQAGGEELLEDLPGSSPNPESQAISQSELQAVSRALATLPERTRRVFELYRLQGQTLQEVATTLSISVGLAHQLVHSALSRCAEELEAMDDF